MKGRGVEKNYKSRFEEIFIDFNDESLFEEEDIPVRENAITKFYLDESRSILSKNESPDLFFNYSINPYRGCEHGCVYCYARPTHEFLGFSAGLDFETKIMVKKNASELLEKEFKNKNWEPQVVSLSGNTDCYQPVERKLELTRKCLEIFLKYGNPVSIITKNYLLLRDIDLLEKLARKNLVTAHFSISSLDDKLVRKMEPRTSTPVRKLKGIKELSEAGIPTGVNIAPIIPGLNDKEISNIIAEAAKNGASFANYELLRLPHAVEEIFLDWLAENFPERYSKIVNRVLDMRGGKLNETNFSKRFYGEGKFAELIKNLFTIACKKNGLNLKREELSTKNFNRSGDNQLELF